MNSQELIERQQRSQRAFYRSLGSGSPGAALLTVARVQATVVPARPWFSIFNSAFYEGVADLERAYDSLASAYEAAGVMAWTVWVPPGDDHVAALLESRGHLLDSTPMLFAASIESLDLSHACEIELEREASWRLVAEVNDRAYGVHPEWTMGAVFETMHDPASRLHVARLEGAPAAALIAREHDHDCYFWFVATVPEARGRGIASELMRHALREAKTRGCTTTTLESTKIAETLYSKLGYLPLGRYQMWERRAG